MIYTFYLFCIKNMNFFIFHLQNFWN